MKRLARLLQAGHALAAGLLLGVLPVATGGCGSGAANDLHLLTAVWWNRDPSSADEIGYQVMVDFGWTDRTTSCFPLSPNLALDVNDQKFMPSADGRCQWDILVAAKGFDHDQPLNIRLHNGEQVLGSATYTGMFPGASAQLLSPADGTVHVGETIVISMPTGITPLNESFGARFYWHDSPAGVPPFHTFMPSALGAASGTIETTAPTLTGSAALVIGAIFPEGYIGSTSCSGFADCAGMPNNDTLGPIAITVVP